MKLPCIHQALYFLSCMVVYVFWYIPATIQTLALVAARPTARDMFLVDPTLLPMRRMHLHVYAASSPPALLHRYGFPALLCKSSALLIVPPGAYRWYMRHSDIPYTYNSFPRSLSCAHDNIA
jgi:hypothetical protein